MQIYQILNKVTGKCYIGKSVNYLKRFNRHKKCAIKKINRRLYDSMNYHGLDNFDLILLEDLGDVSNSFANEREKFWIEFYGSIVPNGYNMTEGGDGGNTIETWSEQAKKDLYILQGSKRRGKRSKEWKEAISKGSILREKNKTKEEKKIISNKISKTLKEKYKLGEIKPNPPTFFGEEHPLYLNVNIDLVLSMIKDCKTLKQISKELEVSPHGIRTRLKEKTGKNFLEWRNEYGIVGKLSKPRRNL